MSDPSKRPSAAQILLAAAAGICLLALGHILLDVGVGSSRGAGLAAAGFAAGAVVLGALAALRRFPELQVSAVITLLTTVGALYVGELYFARLLPGSVVRLVTGPAHQGAWDRRSRIDVLRDMRDAGDRSAVPETYPADVMAATGGLATASGTLMPLGGVSSRTTFSCNETGSWPVYPSDEHGFANPKGLWGQEMDIAAVGDSFGHGNCVSWPDMPLTLIRAAYPRTINVSYSGNGPLIELAAIKEYLPRARPKVVLWLYYEGNDLENLRSEESNPILRRYRTEGAFQSLWDRQAEIDAALDAMIDGRVGNPRNETVTQFVLMRSLRQGLGLGLVDPGLATTHFETDPRTLEPILAEAQRLVAGWGGRIVFVYLPEFARYGQGAASPVSPHHDAVVKSAAGMGLTVVDIATVFDAQPDPVGLYSMRRTNHYTPDGYRLVADAILGRLAAEGVSPAPAATARP